MSESNGKATGGGAKATAGGAARETGDERFDRRVERDPSPTPEKLPRRADAATDEEAGLTGDRARYFCSGRTVAEMLGYVKNETKPEPSNGHTKPFGVLDIVVVENVIARVREATLAAIDKANEYAAAGNPNAGATVAKWKAVLVALDEFTRVVMPPLRRVHDTECAEREAAKAVRSILSAMVPGVG
jgi:hypothetical protein